MGRKGTSTVSQLVLLTLQDCPRTKKELKQALKLAKPSLKKKHTKKALKYLMASGDVEKDEKRYRISVKRPLMPKSVSSFNSVKVSESILMSQNQSVQPVIPIGMKLRNSKMKHEVKVIDESTVDIDDEIKRLEIDLMNETDDSGSSSEEDEHNNTYLATGDPKTEILSMSSFADDRIVSLPQTCLPLPGKYNITKKLGKPSKQSHKPNEKSGLQKAVEEVLDGYTARSSERIPFYCRFCSKQYENESTFYDHKKSKFHKTAVALERKATYCKLCRKQFTSPIQMKEHLSSRPHRERLHSVRSRQRGQYCRK